MDDGFNEMWAAYPRKCAKADARKAWKQTENIRPPLADILKAIEDQKTCCQWTKDGGAFIPYAASWIRGERWEDSHKIDLGCNCNGKAWYESATGIEAKARELNLSVDKFGGDWQAFKAGVYRAAGVQGVRAA